MLEEPDVPDIFNLEFQLQNQINELQWKSEALKSTQDELLQVRQELYNKELISEDRNRKLNDLTMQLTTAHQVIEWTEKEKIQYMNECTQLQINCNSAIKERESLLKQTHAANLENMSLKLNIEKLKENISIIESKNKILEISLQETQEQFLQVKNSIKINVEKLEQEQKLLTKSVESTAELNKRLQTVGLCAHAVYTKKNEQIKNLQDQIALNAQINKVPQIYSNAVIDLQKRSKLDPKAIVDQIHADIKNDYETDKEIDSILKDFESIS